MPVVGVMVLVMPDSGDSGDGGGGGGDSVLTRCQAALTAAAAVASGFPY